MAKRPTINTLTNTASPTYLTQLNQNFTNVRNQFDNTLSLDGSTPNAMNADIDLNGNDLINAGSVNTATLRIGGQVVSPSETVVVDSVAVKKEFDTVALLLADTGTYTNYAEGDYFRVVNGGFTYQVAASGASDQHVTTAGGVKLYVQAGNGFDVKAFGAKGDNSTDDTAEIQAAITAARGSAKKVYIPAGTYIISGSGLSYSSSGNGGVLIEGTSANDINANTGSVLKYTGTGSLFTFTGTPVYSAIRNVTFLGVDGNGAVGLDIDNAWYIDIDQCVFRYFRAASAGVGIKLHYTGAGYFSGVTSIRNCYIANCYMGLQILDTDINVVRVDTCTIFDNTIGFSQGDGAVNPVSSRNVNFNDCLFEGNDDHDIVCWGGAQNWNIVGCYFEQNDATKNQPRINITNSASVQNCAITIQGNTFSKQLQAATQKLVYIKGANGLIFKNNWSAFGNANDRYSIHADGCDNVELMQMSVPFGDTAYPLNDNATIRTTGGVYKMAGGVALAGGIQFPAVQVVSTDPNTLDDYEEGTWTPTNSYVSLTSNKTATYRKIGSLVYASFDVTFAVNAQGNLAEIVGLPFSAGSGASESVIVTWTDYGSAIYMRNDFLLGGNVYSASGAGLTNANMSGKRIAGVFLYHV